jgi:hypothetical protein
VNGWYTLLAIRDEARGARRLPGIYCPNDGTPLDQVRGILHCRFDGWTGSAAEAEPAGPSVPDPVLAGYGRYY